MAFLSKKPSVQYEYCLGVNYSGINNNCSGLVDGTIVFIICHLTISLTEQDPTLQGILFAIFPIYKFENRKI
ncbi:MAG: hypothetical protein UT06_C0015G0020 [Candidatus Woesebacteria bacterium GW2011_GWA1_38_8]|uniref:Uncharacterized protein n=1 Tax=Candidatus Woesebacteria bacterium GW2011_GWA1_38_8 TaxID=1618547 RepID=A0A0G0L7L4_9BACT|nr:MAG: hypothetical protein UT06_C0015G0020 [Candidatus Woesebacteria bacterium GW2011_GWA1_38_8]